MCTSNGLSNTTSLSTPHSITLMILSYEKVEGPTTVMTFLGIKLDTSAQQARLPQDKLRDIMAELNDFTQKHVQGSTCSKWALLSLIGKLAFACKVVPAGRIFLRRLLDLANSVRHLYQHIRISTEALGAIQWCLDFGTSWNGTAFIDP